MNHDENDDTSQADESARPENVDGDAPTNSQQSPTAEGLASVATQSVDRPRFKNRGTGLIFFGVLQIIMGLCCALLVPLMLLSLFVTPPTGAPPSVRMLIPAIAIYGMLAVHFIWLGVGSILARRWARALTLVFSWLWLVIGILTLIMMIFWMPDISTLAAQDKQVPPHVARVIQMVMLGTMVCIYIVLPGIFVAFYQSKHVKVTCDVKDPHVRWTDKCPLPVLALSLLLGYGAFSMIFSMISAPVLPFFGVLLKGVPGGLAFFAITILFAYLAWATYRLKMSAWWTTLVAYAVFGLSSMITFARVDLMEFYREMDMPEEQLKIIEQSGMIERMNMPLMIGVSFVVLLGYMLWVRRYFVGGAVTNVDS